MGLPGSNALSPAAIEETFLGDLEILLHAWLSRRNSPIRFSDDDAVIDCIGGSNLKLSVLIKNLWQYLRPRIDSVLSQAQDIGKGVTRIAQGSDPTEMRSGASHEQSQGYNTVLNL
jgi:hypothetical protein